ncbi:MAG: dTDP-4-dehydrorhamnose reductase [Pseudomonadota bacterium]
MAIMILGKDGQLGWELQRAFSALGPVTSLGRAELDLADVDAIRRAVRAIAPALVVNAAAYTAVDRAEAEPDLARAINALAPGVLAEECVRLGAALIHYSTDYVFDGARRVSYRETDTPNPLNVYGRTKLEGERAVQAAGGAHVIFRTAWVYAARGRNFLLTIRRLSNEREALQVVDDQVGCPTWARLLAEATARVVRASRVVETRDAGWLRERSGLYHLACGGETSWCGFARAIVAQVPGARPVPVHPIPTSAYPTPARRPAYSVLNCDKALQVFGLRLPSWDEGLRLFAADMATSG